MPPLAYQQCCYVLVQTSQHICQQLLNLSLSWSTMDNTLHGLYTTAILYKNSIILTIRMLWLFKTTEVSCAIVLVILNISILYQLACILVCMYSAKVWPLVQGKVNFIHRKVECTCCSHASPKNTQCKGNNEELWKWRDCPWMRYNVQVGRMKLKTPCPATLIIDRQDKP